MGFLRQRGISTFWGISIILMEVTVVLFVFYILYFFWIENPTPTSNILIIRTFRSDVVRIPGSVDTTGWVPFSSDDLGISFYYPSTYSLNEDSIAYGTSEGQLIELTFDGERQFSLSAFTLLPSEIENARIDKVFTRLTGINPSVYQSYEEKVNGHPAVVYRQVPGDQPQDHIYFMNDSYFFESVFNTTSAPILSTVRFTQ